MPNATTDQVEIPVGRTVSLHEVVAAVRGDDPDYLGMQSPAHTVLTGLEVLTDVLADLAEHGVATPPEVRHLLDIIATLQAQPSGIALMLASLRIDEMSPASVVTAIRDYAAATATANAGAGGMVGHDAAIHLLVRAVDELGARADAVVAGLRKQWDPAAALVAKAAAAGMRRHTTAEEALANDTIVPHWRAIDAPVAVLDDLERLVHKVLLITGYGFAPGEAPRSGRGDWLDACADGPAALPVPSERPAHSPARTRTDYPRIAGSLKRRADEITAARTNEAAIAGRNLRG